MRATCAKINLNNFLFNLKEIRSKINSSSKMCIAVKADAYGHGDVECSTVAEKCGFVDYLAVACVSEGVTLRKNGISLPILVLSLCIPEEFDDLISNNLTPLVFDEEYVGLLAEKCNSLNVKKFNVHLAIDTGMGRIGCLPEESGVIAKKIVDSKVLFLEGMCTHFAVADSLKQKDIEYTEKQYEKFLFAIENVNKEGINPGICHCANSAASLNNKKMHLDMCRSGITCYGYYPGDLSEKYFKESGNEVHLKPVMTFVSKVVAIRKINALSSVSYGSLWTTPKDTKIAVIPAGYADGVLRGFNKNGKGFSVAINGKSYPVIGRICMDQFMVEIGEDDSVKRFDEVVIFGSKEEGALQSAQEIAEITNTISYEITCGVCKQRVPRIFAEAEF